MTFKKSAHARERQPVDVLRHRRTEYHAQTNLDPERPVFIDETGASTKMFRRPARCRLTRLCHGRPEHGPNGLGDHEHGRSPLALVW